MSETGQPTESASGTSGGVLWERPGAPAEPRVLLLRALPALLMLVLGAEAVRIGINALSGTPATHLFGVLPVRGMDRPEGIFALALALLALARGVQVLVRDLWNGLPFRLESLPGGLLGVHCDGLSGHFTPSRPARTVNPARVTQAHVVDRRRNSLSRELRVWTGPLSQVIAADDSPAGLESLKTRLFPSR